MTDEKEVDEQAIAMPLTRNAMEYDPAGVIMDARKSIENGEGCRVFMFTSNLIFQMVVIPALILNRPLIGVLFDCAGVWCD